MELKLRHKKRGSYFFPVLITGLLLVNFYMIINHKSIVTTTVAMISAALLITLFFMSLWSIFKKQDDS